MPGSAASGVGHLLHPGGVGREPLRGVDDDHDAGARRLAGRGLDALDRPHGVGVVAGEASRGVQGAGEGSAEEPCDEHEQEHREQAAPRVGAEETGDATGPARARSGRGRGSVWSEEEGSGSSCLDSPPRVPPRSSCRGRHFPSWPRATYSRGGTPRAVRCGRGLHHPPRTTARLARHPGGDPGRGADAVRRQGVRRHVGPRGRRGRRGRRGAGAPLLRDQGRPVPGGARAAGRPARGRCCPSIEGGIDGAGERLLRVFLSVWDDEATRLPLLAAGPRRRSTRSGQRLVRDGLLPHGARAGRRRARPRPTPSCRMSLRRLAS